jgi:hypothetical protein
MDMGFGAQEYGAEGAIISLELGNKRRLERTAKCKLLFTTYY